MDISDEVSGAEEGEPSSSYNSDDKEEPEAKGAEEKQPEQSAVADAAPPDGADAPHKKPRTKKTKHKKTAVNDVCMPMRQAERESAQREHGDQTGEAATVPPGGNSAKPRGSRKKAKKPHKATEAGKAKEAVRDSSSLSSETVATVTMDGRQEEESATIGLLDLPEEVLLGVLSFLAPPDLVLVSQACRLLQLLSREPTILRALREHHRIHKGKNRARLQPLFVHPAYYALEQPRYTLKQLESLDTPSVVLNRLVEDGFFFLRLDDADLQIVRDMRAAASRFLASSEGLDAMSRRSMLYLKTSAAGYAEAPEINSFQTTVTHHRWFPWPDATDEDKAVATRYWRLMGRITVVLLTNLAKHLGIPMSVMELLLFSRKKVMHRYGDDSFLASDSAHAQWSCELCTLLNPGTRRTCAACQGPRPLARPEAVSANQVEGEQTQGDGQQPQPLNEAATKVTTAETTAETVGSPFTREKLVAVTDEELDRLLAPTLKFYRFRELEKRRKDGWRGRDGSLRVLTPRGSNPAAAAAADVVDVDHGLGAGDGMIHLLEEPTPLPLPPPLPQPTREDAQHQQQATGEQQRRKRKADFSTQLNMMPCNAMFKLISAHSTDPDLCQVELRTERPDSDNRPHRLPVSKMANEGDIAVFPSWSLRTFCAPFGVRFAYRQPSYRVRSRLVKVLPGSSSSTSAGGDLYDSPDAPEKRPEARERSMSDPTTPGSTAQLQDRPLRASSISKGKEKRDGRAGAGGGKSSSAIVLNKEAKQALVRKHKKSVLLLEYDSYVPPPELVRCMKKVITMMEKEGNKSVGRWYKKKRGRIIEACPWNRYYPSSSESESDLDTSEWGSSSDSFSTSASDDDEDDEEAMRSDDGDESESESDSESDAEAYYGGFGGGRYSDSDMSSRSDDLARMRHRFEGSEDEAILADVSYWNGPMPLTKHERRERDRRDKRKRRIKKAKKVALTTAFVAAVPVTIVTAPIWLPIGGALALGLRFHFRRK